MPERQRPGAVPPAVRPGRAAGRTDQTAGRATGGFLGRLQRSGFAMLSLSLLVLGVLMLAPSVKLLLDQRREIDALQAEVAAGQQQVDARTEALSRWSDPVFVRAQVRERLFYVMPGEIAYLVIDDLDAPVDEEPPVSDALAATQVDWAGNLGLSVLIAGAGDPDPEALLGGAGSGAIEGPQLRSQGSAPTAAAR